MTWCFVEKYLKVPNEIFPNCFQERQKRHKFQSTVHQKRGTFRFRHETHRQFVGARCQLLQGIRKTRGSDCPQKAPQGRGPEESLKRFEQKCEHFGL